MGEVVYHEARFLAEHGYEISVFTLAYASTIYPNETEPYKIIRLKPLIFRWGGVGSIPQIMKHLASFDIIHLHYPFYGGMEWVWLFSKLKKKKLVVTYHMNAKTTGWLKPLVQKSYDWFFGKRILASAQKIIVINKDYLKLPSSIRGERVIEIPNGVDTMLFQPTKNGITWRANSEKIILFVGNMLALKRLDLLIEAFSVARSSVVGCRLVIVGGGYQEEVYKKLVTTLNLEDNVTFAGPCLDKQKLVGYYNQAWCTVVPSDTESFSLVISEALSSGCPVIASDAEGIRTRVDEGKDGLLFEAGNTEALAQTLRHMLSLSVEERKKMGEYGRKKMIVNFSWDKHMNALEKVYREIYVI
jgi:glycosyltransferase involved in cell wall biosynthesis